MNSFRHGKITLCLLAIFFAGAVKRDYRARFGEKLGINLPSEKETP